MVVVDTRRGPVLLDRGAVLQSFTRIEGPCYVGPESWVVGGKICGTSLGPCCRVGGEVQETILQGFSNKYHDGFLGHSYLGEWVNLAAGTQVSDLRNDYRPIKVSVGGERIPSGRTKIGAFIGDHTKTGLATLINSGTSIGAFCNLLPGGSYLPNTIPSFCQARDGVVSERNDLRQMIQTAATVMRRRGFEMTDAHVNFFFDLFDQTAARRRKLLHDIEVRPRRRII
jgi:UDP-N-acetylglucosamine diphosphorylase/glucosamine-1-phosphate N-acetyltransferase